VKVRDGPIGVGIVVVLMMKWVGWKQWYSAFNGGCGV